MQPASRASASSAEQRALRAAPAAGSRRVVVAEAISGPFRGSNFDVSASCSNSSRSCLGEPLGHVYRDHRVQVAARAVRVPGRPWPRRRSRRPLEDPAGTFTRALPVERRHGHLGAERGLPGRHRQIDVEIASLDAEAGVRFQAHAEEQVPGGPSADARAALSGEADPLPVTDATRDLDLEVASVVRARCAACPPRRPPRGVSSSTASWSPPAHREAVGRPPRPVLPRARDGPAGRTGPRRSR